MTSISRRKFVKLIGAASVACSVLGLVSVRGSK
ncbi:MAG: twin-arginine translocation signal domain-containing protein [Verrucomicrobia bacterium]|nr:twin-arginine translocation signal domain-containing protein [Verrucomicrobiota bacterium]